ncbi:MAG: ParA family partition ATPase [Methylococcales bacterium]|jgi:chromosome partitioning protein
MSKIIAILNQKGGAGKTTIATNLAHALQIDGHKVILVDSDPQGSARDWNAASDGAILQVVGMDRSTLAKDIHSVVDNYDFIIIDGAPQIADLAIAAIKCADVILIPVQPSPYDIWACEDLVEIIKARQEITEGKPKAAFIISRVIKNTQLSKEIKEALEGYSLPVFKNYTSQRVAYATSAATGATVVSKETKSDASNEIHAIAQELKDFL